MGYWPAGVDNAALYKMGPYLDGFVGTNGETSDLYNAIHVKNWTRFIVAAGATCSADVQITNDTTWIYALYSGRGINLGARQIDIAASRVYIHGIRLISSVGVAWLISSGGDIWLDGCAAETAGSHGFHLTTAGNDNVLTNCYARSCGGNGVLINTGADTTRINGGFFWANTLYGIDDSGPGNAIICGARIAANTAGQVNPGAGTVHANLNVLI